MNKISIAKRKQLKKGYVVELQIDESPKNIKDKKILHHEFTTEPGDSGSPLMVVFPEIENEYFVIAIHRGTSGTKDSNKPKDRTKDTQALPSNQEHANKVLNQQIRLAVKITDDLLHEVLQIEASITKPQGDGFAGRVVEYEASVNSFREKMLYYQSSIRNEINPSQE